MPSLFTRRSSVVALSAFAMIASLAVASPAGAATGLDYTDMGDHVAIMGCDGTCPEPIEVPVSIAGKPVTEIGPGAFSGETGVTGMTLPEGLTTIGPDSFAGMTGLKTITLPSTVTSIGPSAFSGDSSLRAVLFLGNAASIGPGAFSGVHSGAKAYITSGTLTGYGAEGDVFNGLTVAYDTTAPEAPGSFTAEDALVSNPVSTTIDFTLAEEGGTVECRFNDGDWGACTSVDGTAGKFTVSSLTGGEQSISVRQTDDAGNASEVGSVYLAPKLIDGPVGSVVPGSGVSFQIAHAEGATLMCKVQTVLAYADWSSCQYMIDTTYFSSEANGSSMAHVTLEPGTSADGVTTRPVTACVSGSCLGGDGSNTLAFKQEINGQTSLETKATWTQDTTGPNSPTFSGKPDAFTKSRSAAIGFTADEANVTFECSVDDGPYAACASPQSFSALPDGPHSLGVKATDTLGNVGGEGKASWTVDNVAPAAPTVTSPASSSASGTTVPFNATGEVGATLRCSLDGGEFVSCPKATPAPGDQSTMTVGWNTKLHWGEASDWSSVTWGTLLPFNGGFPMWGTTRNRSEFPDGVTLSAIWLGNTASGMWGTSCENYQSSFGAWGYKVLVGVPGVGPTVYTSFVPDCSSTLAEVQPSVPAQFTSLGGGEHTLSVKQVDAAGNESPVTSKSWFVGEVGAPRLLSKVGLKLNFRTRVTTLKLNAAADTAVPGNSIKWVEYFSREKRPAANAPQNPKKIRRYATTVVLPAKEVAFWVRVKDTKGKWSGWYSTKK